MFKKIKDSKLNDEEKSKAVSKILGEAVGFDISEQALKVKNLLLGVSITLLSMVVGGVSVGKTVSFLGISLEGITGNKMVFGLVVAVAWVTIHHAWYSIEACKEWRLRITGQRVAYQTGAAMFGSPYSESPSSPRHATLYNWWKERSGTVISINDAVAKVEEELVGIQEKVDQFVKSSLGLGHSTNVAVLENLLSSVSNLKENMAKNVEFMNSPRIEASLYRFDNWFWRMVNIQNVRVIIVEITLPFLLGVSSFVAGAWYLYCNPA